MSFTNHVSCYAWGAVGPCPIRTTTTTAATTTSSYHHHSPTTTANYNYSPPRSPPPTLLSHRPRPVVTTPSRLSLRISRAWDSVEDEGLSPCSLRGQPLTSLARMYGSSPLAGDPYMRALYPLR
ncbi:hypothetical protein DFS34DRAFT_654734 [Phlyctochytrium arcticum]|nr:hypothetical protein DFS34DRAFT_654734 [Phlyctochytrium arcticum]